LQRLGLILHVTPNHNIIIRVENPPRINETVVDENLQPVGKVFDIIGPTSKPYAEIRPTISDPERLLNKMVYTIPSRRRKEKNPHGR
jgi:rRNA processing protein Gar1